MRYLIGTVFLLSSHVVFPQDSTLTFGYYPKTQQAIRVVTENGVVAISHLGNNTDPVFNEIQNLEERESKALQRRDTAELKRLWTRDFTTDVPANKVMPDKTGLAYYELYMRFVEHVDIRDTKAYSNGTELIRAMDDKTKTVKEVHRKYMHVWQNSIGGWKLISKFGYEVKK